jgi:hypothetical protein
MINTEKYIESSILEIINEKDPQKQDMFYRKFISDSPTDKITKKIRETSSERKCITSEHFSQNYCFEQELKKELKRSREISNKDHKDFEDELKAYYFGVDLVIKRSYTNMNEKTYQFEINQGSSEKVYNLHVTINRNSDAVGDPYLLLKFISSEIGDDIVYDLLGLHVQLFVGGQGISSFCIATNIFLAKLCDKDVQEENRFIKIPLMIFHSSDGDIIKMIALQYHEMKIKIDMVSKNIIDKIEGVWLNINEYFYDNSSGYYPYCGKNISGDCVDKSVSNHKRRHDAQIPFQNMIIDSNSYFVPHNELGDQMPFPPHTKFIIFRFVPKSNNNFNDLVFLQPNITEVMIFTSDVRNNNNNISILIFNILSISFMNTTLFVAPLTHESLSWNSIKESIKKCNFEETYHNFTGMKVKIITDIPYDNYDVIITPVSFNFIRCMSGMMGKAYATFDR